MRSTRYTAPDFDSPPFQSAPHARTMPAPADGVAPTDFYASTNFPTYIHSSHGWHLTQKQRMDAVIRQISITKFECVEARNLKKDDLVVLGYTDASQEGILAHHNGFDQDSSQEIFSFMGAGNSREKIVRYDALADILLQHKQQGYIIWVCGPAVVHSDSQKDFSWLIQNGFVQTMFAGNAVATHDLERAVLGTSLGINDQGQGIPNGHRHHLSILNQVRQAGSISEFIQQKQIQTGIMAKLETYQIPYVLAGSIRDDGPLPEVITDSLQAQNTMRQYTNQATLVIMLASALHSIATGNLLPVFYQTSDGQIHPLQTIVVDQDEFLLNKLVDRGSHQAFGVARNVSDFLSQIRTRLAGD